jgi:hypothetical protein
METQYTLTGTQLLELTYQICGATSAVFLLRDPMSEDDFVKIAEEVKTAALRTLADFGFTEVGVA